MALPPHIVKGRIDSMPDGPEKDRRLASFHRQIRICTWGYFVMLLVAAATTIGLLVVLLTSTFVKH